MILEQVQPFQTIIHRFFIKYIWLILQYSQDQGQGLEQ